MWPNSTSVEDIGEWPGEWHGLAGDSRDERKGISRRSALKTGGTVAGATVGGSLLSSSRAAALGDSLLGGDEDNENTEPEYPTPAWFERELKNFEMVLQAPREQTTATFQERLSRQEATNAATSLRQEAEEPEWQRANPSLTWEGPYAGDVFRYPSVDPFYGIAGERTRVAFYDNEGARLNGRVWVPADSEPGDNLPGVVIVNGSVQATEPLYFWATQTLVEHGYMVMTYDPRGQGRSDTTTPGGEAGTNINPEVFVTNQVAAIDFLHSTPDDLYPPTERYGDPDNSAPELPFNPYHDRLDRDRLGIAGHSAGAIGVSIAQGLEPWPGLLDDQNPVDVAVAWDNLGDAEQIGDPRTALLTDFLYDVLAQGPYSIEPRVPAMGQAGDYFLTPVPYLAPPDPEAHRLGFSEWKAAGVPAYQIVIRGGSHYEFSTGAYLPTTSWRPPNAQEGGAEEPFGFGNPMADYYTLAWLDRWLKQPGEQGYDTADERLLNDEKYVDRMSFYYQSARDFPDRQGERHVAEDIRGDAPDSDGPRGIAAVLDDADENILEFLNENLENIDNIYDQVVEVDPIPTSVTEIASSNALTADVPDAAQGTPLVGSLQGVTMIENRLQHSDDPDAEELQGQVSQIEWEMREILSSLFD